MGFVPYTLCINTSSCVCLNTVLSQKGNQMCQCYEKRSTHKLWSAILHSFSQLPFGSFFVKFIFSWLFLFETFGYLLPTASDLKKDMKWWNEVGKPKVLDKKINQSQKHLVKCGKGIKYVYLKRVKKKNTHIDTMESCSQEYFYLTSQLCSLFWDSPYAMKS